MIKPLIIGVSGATGTIYAVRLLEILKELKIPTILVVSEIGFLNAKQELNIIPKDLIKLADEYYNNTEMTASIASGSFLTQGMIIAPCSVKTLSNVANCNDNNLIARAADVTLKERRKLVLLFRETPLHMGHIRLLEQVTSSGGIVMPPVPAFYNKPQTIEDLVLHTVFRCLDLFDINSNYSSRWGKNSGF